MSEATQVKKIRNAETSWKGIGNAGIYHNPAEWGVFTNGELTHKIASRSGGCWQLTEMTSGKFRPVGPLWGKLSDAKRFAKEMN